MILNVIFIVIAVICFFTMLVLLYKLKTSRPIVGTLRIDRSDITDGPYMFLEVDKGGIDKIYTNKEVTLKVSFEDYIPRN